MPAKDLPALKVAMLKHAKVGDIGKLPRNQRDLLQKYNNALGTAAYKTRQSMMAITKNLKEEAEPIEGGMVLTESSNDPPMILVLRRKGVRQYPDGRKVALYNNEKLGLVFTLPYAGVGGERQIVVGNQNEELEIMESLDQVSKFASEENPKATARHMKFADGSKLKVSHGAAKAIHMVHGALNDENKKKYAEMLKDPKKFEKAAHFALSKVNFTIKQ